MKITSRLLVIISILTSERQALTAALLPIYSPPELSFEDGNGRVFPGTINVHFQQLYDSSSFLGLPSGGGLLREVWFRADENFGQRWFSQFSGVQVKMSLFSGSSLSPVFANNLLGDVDTFQKKEDSNFIYSGWNGSGRVADFGLFFGTSAGGFQYDPTKGNLLLDITGLDLPFALDSYKTERSTSVWQDPLAPFASTGILKSESLATLFTFIVPEPSPLLLIGGALGLFLVCRVANSQTKEPNVTV